MLVESLLLLPACCCWRMVKGSRTVEYSDPIPKGERRLLGSATILRARAETVRPTQASQMKSTETRRGRDTLANQKWSLGTKYLAPAIAEAPASGLEGPQRPCQTSVLERRQDPRVVVSGSWRKEDIASPRVARGWNDFRKRSKVVARMNMVRRFKAAVAPRRGMLTATEQVDSGPVWARQYFTEDFSSGVRSAKAGPPLGVLVLWVV